MSRQVPEYLQLLKSRYPEFEQDSIIIANIGGKINHHQSSEPHTEVVVSQCRVAWEISNSILCLVAYDYGLGAMSLCRNLFELVVGTIFLIENPDKLEDFIDYGKTIAYEVAESMGAEQKYLAAFKQKANYDNLKKHFGREKWHGKTIRGLAEAAGMANIYESFYKEASSIAHGDSYVSLGYHDRKWQFSKDVRSWSSYCEASLTFSFLLMANLYHRTVHKLKLPYVRDVQAVMGRLIQKGLVSL
ncbi:MAG: DUF5677 domain-containing protein [Nitrososphaerales archaeon]